MTPLRNDESSGPPRRIDQISTHQDAVSDPARFVFRYSRAISAYLSALVRDEDIAQEVLQDFLLKIVARGFTERDESRGRFRDYLKVAIRNAALTELRRRKIRQTADVDVDTIELIEEADDVWLKDWRECLLDLAWRELERVERASETNFGYSVLKLSVDYENEGSSQLAERATQLIGHSFTAESYRKQLSRARLRFSEAICISIAETLETPTDEAIKDEVAELGLSSFLAT